MTVHVLNSIKAMLRREEFQKKPLKVLCNVLRWQFTSAFQTKIKFKWFGGLLIECGRSETGFTGNIYFGLMERKETYFFLSTLGKDDLFVDVGANVGAYSLLIGRLTNASCIAIEPSKNTFEKLTINIEKNKLGHVQLFNVALGSEEKEVSFTKGLGPENYIVDDEHISTETVPQSTLDQLIEHNSIFMKIDTEGYELEVLKGARKLLSQGAIKAIICEINDKLEKLGSEPVEIYELLEHHGYVSCRLDSHGLIKGQFTGPNKLFVLEKQFDSVNSKMSANFHKTQLLEF